MLFRSQFGPQGIYDVTFGPNCANVHLSGGKILGIDLESGQAGPCTPSTPAVAPIVRDELKDYRAITSPAS